MIQQQNSNPAAPRVNLSAGFFHRSNDQRVWPAWSLTQASADSTDFYLQRAPKLLLLAVACVTYPVTPRGPTLKGQDFATSGCSHDVTQHADREGRKVPLITLAGEG